MSQDFCELILPSFLWRQDSMSPQDRKLLDGLLTQMSQEERDLTHRNIITLFTQAELAARKTPEGRTKIFTRIKRELSVETRRFRQGNPSYDSERLERLVRLTKVLSPDSELSGQELGTGV